jgi:hypothetical protein
VNTALRRGFVGLILWLSACGAESVGRAPSTFVVEVRGSKAALERFALASPQLPELGPIVFSSGSLSRRLSTTAPWSNIKGSEFEIVSSSNSGVISRVETAPFLCTQDSMFESRVDDGWTITETHQAHLDTNGTLTFDTDFDRKLFYSCEMSSRTSKDGDGLGTIIHREPQCANEQRIGTDVRMRGSVDGLTLDAPMTTCWALLSDVGDGEISLELLAYTAFGHVSLALSHCLSTPDDAFPTTLMPTEDVRCPTGVGVGVFDGSALRQIAATGTWTISSASFARGGRVAGTIDISAHGEDGDELHFVGAFQLPFIRVPIEGDWHP